MFFYYRGLMALFACYAIYFVIATMIRIPRDLASLITLYNQRKMTDFYVDGTVMLGFWLASAIFAYLFMYPLVKFAKDMVEIYS